ncbi:Uncharacterised protein [Nocardiopsis dassonvillei]|nr:Uncharacterised protein [Nocardiopsis dassonvillei]
MLEIRKKVRHIAIKVAILGNINTNLLYKN